MLNSNKQPLHENYQDNSLNLYSLLNFKDIIKPLLMHSSIQSICEIGVEKSNLTKWLAALSYFKNFDYSGVDPTVDSIPKFFNKNSFFQENSLTYLNRPEAIHDLFLIDGDHNYYTVYHELQSIFLKENPKQSICLLHDVLPPCGNRDLYYKPSNIPDDFLHPFTSVKSLNSNFEICEYGYNSCGKFSWAIESGNPKNGVSTAIKDFLTKYEKKFDLYYFTIPLFYGLGILYSKKLINPSLQKTLSKKNIYCLLANEKLFQHIETNRIKLYINLISEQQMKEAKIREIKLIKSSQPVHTRNVLFSTFLKKIYIHLSKKKNTITSLNKILLRCADSEVISFDFFDTIVHRIIFPPDNVKLKTAEFASIQLKQLNYCITAKKFNEIRREKEIEIRDNNFHKKAKDHEADIFSIIEQTLLQITHEKINFLIIKIINYEVMNEINHLYLNAEVKNVLKELKNKGKKIIICSDMYLSEEHIRKIANNFGILNYIDKFYVSSTKKITKGSGRLFQFIVKDLNLSAKKILHIGDNYVSDYLSPRKIGIKAICYYNKKIIKNYKKISRSLEQINYTKKTINKKFIKKFISVNDYKKNDYKKISDQISPVLSLFAYQSLLDMYSRGIRKIFFFAREGILLKKIFNEVLNNVLLFQNEKNVFELKVIHISRLSSSCAIYKAINNIDSLIETTQYATGSLSIPNLIKTYGLSTEDFSVETLKLIESYPPFHSDIDSFNTLLTHTSFGKEFNQLLTRKRKLLERYLKEQGVFEGKVGMVDLGWGGTIQKNMNHFLPDYPLVEFFGYYFGTNNLIYDKNALACDRSTFFPGYIVAYQNDYQIKKLYGTIPFLESLCGRDEIGTTIGYTSNADGITTPILDTSIKKNSYNIRLQKKVRYYLLYDTKNFCSLLNVASIPIEKLKKYLIKNFFNFIFKPKNINLKKFQRYKFNSNWSLNLEKDLINTIQLSDIFKPIELLKKIRKSPWQYGTIAAAPIPFLLSIYNLGHYCFSFFPAIRNKIKKLLCDQKNFNNDR